MTLTPLFEGVDVPFIHSTFGVDSPRTRRTDPATSHRAGDKSAETITEVKRALLELVRTRGTLTGSQANVLYREMALRPGSGLSVVAWDSPRKRLGELAAEKVLVALNPDHVRGTETVYGLPDEQKERVA